MSNYRCVKGNECLLRQIKPSQTATRDSACPSTSDFINQPLQPLLRNFINLFHHIQQQDIQSTLTPNHKTNFQPQWIPSSRSFFDPTPNSPPPPLHSGVCDCAGGGSTLFPNILSSTETGDCQISSPLELSRSGVTSPPPSLLVFDMTIYLQCLSQERRQLRLRDHPGNWRHRQQGGKLILSSIRLEFSLITSMQANKQVAKDSNASLSTRAQAAKDAVG